MKEMILDVGCGSSPKGHVNIDLFVGETPHQDAKPINPKLIPNFIKAHAEYLPIRKSSFDVVVCCHVLEHLDNPTKALLDMVRVAKEEVVFTVPHRFARRTWLRYRQHEMHKHFFSSVTTREWLWSLGLSFEDKPLYKYFPHSIFPLIRLPYEIEVKVREQK